MPRVLKFDLRAKKLSEMPAYAEDATLLWSSRPYPMALVESLSAPLLLASGRMYVGLHEQTDELGSLMSLSSGSLRTPLQSAVAGPEALDTALDLSGGELRALLKSYANWPPENLDSALSLAGGSLVVGLVSYPNWPTESLDTTLALSSGSLS